jgi:DNA-binding beta-propeller fold protein YncE
VQSVFSNLNYNIFGFVYNSVGELYFSPHGNYSFIGKISVVNTSFVLASIFAGDLESGFADGVGSFARFSHPDIPVFDNQGNIFVSDSNNKVIRRITTSAEVTTIAGDRNRDSGDGVGTFAGLGSPEALVYDPRNSDLYVIDALNNVLKLIDNSYNVRTIATADSYFEIGSITSSGIGTSSEMHVHIGLALFIPTNSLYIADTVNNAIRKLNLINHQVSLVAGLPHFKYGFHDGFGTNAKFSAPRGIAVDSNGYIFVTDKGNYAIRMITSTQEVITIAGSHPNRTNLGAFVELGMIDSITIGFRHGELLFPSSYNHSKLLTYSYSERQYTPQVF